MELTQPQDGQPDWRPVSSLQWNVKQLTAGRGKAARTILSDLWGEVRKGTFTIILGPSGSGKTSLLECLSLRLRTFRGVVLVDGAVPNSDYFFTAAMVYQQELLPPYLTPREHLTYHASARMSRSSMPAIRQRVQEVIEETGLTKCADTMIGGGGLMFTTKGISGGERKRVGLAIELLQCPAIIFLDEPCSGLDSVMSQTVVTTLSDLANSGRIVMASLHSPTSDTMAMVTNVVLLTWDGRLAYQGPRAHVVDHFQSIGYVYPEHVSTADYLLKIASRRELRASPEQEKARSNNLAGRFRESPLAMEQNQLLSTLGPIDMYVGRLRQYLAFGQQVALTGFWQNYCLTTWRFYTQISRQTVAIVTIFALLIGIGIFLGLLYFGTAKVSWRSILGVNFSFMTCSFLFHTLGLTLQHPLTNAFVNREVLSGVNMPGPYMVAVFTAMPHWFIGVVAAASIIYWMTGMPPNLDLFLWYNFINILLCMGAAAVSIAAGSVSHNSSICLCAVSLMLVPMILFNGMLYERDTLIPAVAWLENISIINYGFKSIMIKTAEHMPPAEAALVRAFLNLNPDDFGFNLIMVTVLSVGLFFIAYIELKVRFYLGGSRMSW